MFSLGLLVQVDIDGVGSGEATQDRSHPANGCAAIRDFRNGCGLAEFPVSPDGTRSAIWRGMTTRDVQEFSGKAITVPKNCPPLAK